MGLLTDHDIYLLKEGNHLRLYEKMGAHPAIMDGVTGTLFAVWAPNAGQVFVAGDFNNWDNYKNPLSVRPDNSGVWEGFIPGVGKGNLYKFHIVSKFGGFRQDKSDPFSFYSEVPPKTASIVWDLKYFWSDREWMQRRKRVNALNSPMSVYEVHLGSWRRVPEENDRFLTYREMAPLLAEHVKIMGFTHVELLPVMEHPFYGSWGYQSIGYFSPTSRYGSPQDFMYFVDYLHRNGIGVILDWVPSHFVSDGHGLVYFDGTHLYEHADPRKGFHPEWGSYIFNCGRDEVRSFLLSSALFWLEIYHVDGLRVDAVASMLYLDYARKNGDWIPNEYGGKENLEAVRFLRRLNEMVYAEYPDVQTFAEESSAWPMVSRPTYSGGLGFGMKWNMGWMHDTLEYFSKAPVHRYYHHNQLTFSIWYAFYENFLLPLSHDEVVYGKGSLINKMPGDDWQKFANLRLLFGYMYGHPGKKLLFMGGEFGQRSEWNHDTSLDWHLLDHESHRGLMRWLQDLNQFYRKSPALFERDFESLGFEWVDCHNAQQSIISFLRKGQKSSDTILVVCNMTPSVWKNYKVGVPEAGIWKEVLNSDAKEYYGSGVGNPQKIEATFVPAHGRSFSISLNIPALAAIFLKKERLEAPQLSEEGAVEESPNVKGKS